MHAWAQAYHGLFCSGVISHKLAAKQEVYISTMSQLGRTTCIFLAFLSCSCHGHRVEDEFRAIAKLLTALNPSSGWQAIGTSLGHGFQEARSPSPFRTSRAASRAIVASGRDDSQSMSERGTTRRAALLTVAASTLASQQASAADEKLDESIAVVKPKFVARGIPIAEGVRMPTLALNTAGMSQEDTTRAVKFAFQAGFTHLDFHPGIERDGVAKAIRTEAREKFFLTTKIRKADKDVSPAEAAKAVKQQIDEDRAALDVDQVDLLLLRDHPSCDVMKAQWKAMERTLETGKTRAIGVANYCQGALSCVLEDAKVRPAVNYIMFHPGMGTDPQGLRSFGEKRGITTFAYGVLGEPGPSEELLKSEVLAKVSRGRSPEEVAIRWVLQSGVPVSVRPTTAFSLGKSSCEGDSCKEGLLRRTAVFSKALQKEEMKAIDAMTSPDGNPTLFSSEGCPGPSPLRP